MFSGYGSRVDERENVGFRGQHCYLSLIHRRAQRRRIFLLVLLITSLGLYATEGGVSRARHHLRSGYIFHACDMFC